ncbi:MAG: hypothetical protein ITG00_04720 [Flavobacterium sp.]|nr:hypothetical protein [Flavobacterium sp.]
MSCQFTIHYPQPKELLVAQLEDAMRKTNGEFNGDALGGVFSGNTPVGGFSGSYSIDGDMIFVTIDKKPWLVSCGRIEDEINNYLNQGTA